MSQKDYYKVLGVSEGADEAVIKKAYRKLAVQYHPDKHQGASKAQAEARFKEISEAYYVLSDAKRRAQYDQMRRFGGARGSGNFAGAQGFDFEELLRQFSSQGRGPSGRYSVFGDVFEDLFRDGARGARYEYRTAPGFGSVVEEAQADADVVVNLRITRQKAEKGGEVNFKTPEGKKISVKIPPKIKSGQKLRLARQGRTCPTCRHEGDLILRVKVEERDGAA